METSNCLDDLIECLWQVLGSGTDRQSTFPCRQKCLECLERLVGADHHYAQCFRNFVQQGDDVSLLIAGGILNALKEEIAKREALHNSPEDKRSGENGIVSEPDAAPSTGVELPIQGTVIQEGESEGVVQVLDRYEDVLKGVGRGKERTNGRS